MNKPFSRLMTIALTFIITACSMGAPTPTATPVTTNTPVPPTATITPSPTLTPTPVPMISVVSAVDCYAGPTMQFDKVASLEANAQIRLVGASEDGTFWIVALEDGKECWLSKENATVTAGEVAALPQVVPPATPTLGPPAAPSNFAVKITCDFIPSANKPRLYPGFIITWIDNAGNEDGFIIYQDGEEVTRLPADSTQYSNQININVAATFSRAPMLYGVSAYNSAGISLPVEVSVHIVCPQ